MKPEPRCRVCVLVAAALLLWAHPTRAQTDSTSWNPEVIGHLSFAQTGFSNWAEGGVNSLAFSGGIRASAAVRSGRWNREHDVRLAFGLIRQDSVGYRKAEDLLRTEMTLMYGGNGFFARFKPTIAVRVRSQFADGFDYEFEPPKRVSTFLTPATLTETIGLTSDLNGLVFFQAGVGSKQTIVTTSELRSRYGVNPNRTVRWEVGLDVVAEIDTDITTNVHVNAAVSFFNALDQKNRPDILGDVLVTMKVNDWLHVNFEWTTVYDFDITRAMQMKEILSLGVSWRLL